MTEAEWRDSSDLRRMLDFVGRQATVHKLLAFASAFDRLFPGPSPRGAQPAGAADWQLNAQVSYNDYLLVALPLEVLRRAFRDLPPDQQQAARSAGCRLLREIFAPFHSVSLNPTWLVMNDWVGRKLAAGIYADEGFDRLAVLADALEDAGCADVELLSHLRSPGPHVRGCWALDLILGKS